MLLRFITMRCITMYKTPIICGMQHQINMKYKGFCTKHKKSSYGIKAVLKP